MTHGCHAASLLRMFIAAAQTSDYGLMQEILEMAEAAGYPVELFAVSVQHVEMDEDGVTVTEMNPILEECR